MSRLCACPPAPFRARSSACPQARLTGRASLPAPPVQGPSVAPGPRFAGAARPASTVARARACVLAAFRFSPAQVNDTAPRGAGWSHRPLPGVPLSRRHPHYSLPAPSRVSAACPRRASFTTALARSCAPRLISNRASAGRPCARTADKRASSERPSLQLGCADTRPASRAPVAY